MYGGSGQCHASHMPSLFHKARHQDSPRRSAASCSSPSRDLVAYQQLAKSSAKGRTSLSVMHLQLQIQLATTSTRLPSFLLLSHLPAPLPWKQAQGSTLRPTPRHHSTHEMAARARQDRASSCTKMLPAGHQSHQRVPSATLRAASTSRAAASLELETIAPWRAFLHRAQPASSHQPLRA